MIHVDVRTTWRIRIGHAERELDTSFLALIGAIAESGKLTQAAKSTGISYRHAWTLLDAWASFMGAPLVKMQRGRGAALTPIGERLLWAGLRARSRLSPELDSLGGDLTADMAELLSRPTPVVTVHASNDYALSLLRDRLVARGRTVNLQRLGSIRAMQNLARGDCTVAGFHVGDGLAGAMLPETLLRALEKDGTRLCVLAHRRQGIIVPAGNPLKIFSMKDVGRRGLRVVQRPPGTGTRRLFEHLLALSGLDPTCIETCQGEEVTHAGVALRIAAGQADLGLGLEAAAAEFHLGFVPVATERYFLAIASGALDCVSVRALLETVESPEFRAAVNALPGYRAPEGIGLLPVREALADA